MVFGLLMVEGAKVQLRSSVSIRIRIPIRQPQLGLLHVEEKELKIAHVTTKGCHAEYSVICLEGVYEAHESAALFCSWELSYRRIDHFAWL